METVSLDSGRATWLFPIEEFVPLGGTEPMAIVHGVAERYGFRNAPENPTREEIDKNGLRFSAGVFELEGKRSGVGEFILYSDGIVAVSNTTEHSNAFLYDVMNFAIEEYQFRQPISPVKRVNFSTVTVEFDSGLKDILAEHASLVSLVSKYLNAARGTSQKVEVTRLDFTLDDPALAANIKPKFNLESRVGVPLERNRFFSNAALATADHLELLAALEKLLSSGVRGRTEKPVPRRAPR